VLVQPERCWQSLAACPLGAASCLQGVEAGSTVAVVVPCMWRVGQDGEGVQSDWGRPWT